MNQLYSEIQFLPVFLPNTKIYWYDASKQKKISPGLLGNLLLNEIPTDKEDERLNSVSAELLRFTWSGIPFALPVHSTALMIEEFMNDTYQLINAMAEETSFPKYASYCNKYGSLFPSEEITLFPNSEEITFFDLWVAFNHLKVILNILKNPSFDIHGFCRKLSQAINNEHKLTSIQNIEFFVLYHTIEKDSQDDLNRGHYSFKEINIMSLRGSETKKFPLFRLIIKGSLADTVLLNTGSFIQKSDWLKQQILTCLTETINNSSSNLSIHIENNIPKISMTINDRLVYFLFNILVNNDSFNICPYCGKLLTNGTRYCNRKHMESYKKSTPESKLSNMVSKWSQHGQITTEQYNLFVNKGKELLNKYPYEIVKKRMQSLKEKQGK